MNRSRKILLATGGITAALALGGCAGASNPVPAARGSAACDQILALNLPSLDNAVDSANDFGAQPPNGATQLTGAQLAVLRADGKILSGLSTSSPQFNQDAHAAGHLLQIIGNSLNGYVDDNQAPAMDRAERNLQGSCGGAS